MYELWDCVMWAKHGLRKSTDRWMRSQSALKVKSDGNNNNFCSETKTVDSYCTLCLAFLRGLSLINGRPVADWQTDRHRDRARTAALIAVVRLQSPTQPQPPQPQPSVVPHFWQLVFPSHKSSTVRVLSVSLSSCATDFQIWAKSYLLYILCIYHWLSHRKEFTQKTNIWNKNSFLWKNFVRKHTYLIN